MQGGSGVGQVVHAWPNCSMLISRKEGVMTHLALESTAAATHTAAWVAALLIALRVSGAGAILLAKLAGGFLFHASMPDRSVVTIVLQQRPASAKN